MRNTSYDPEYLNGSPPQTHQKLTPMFYSYMWLFILLCDSLAQSSPSAITYVNAFIL